MIFKKTLPILVLACVLLVGWSAVAAVNEGDNDSSGAATGLPLPRFASLKTDEVNMRTGPGTRYPIEWVLTRKGLPVEITAEYEIWRRIREPEGAEGWVHKTALSGKRTAIITGQTRDLHMKDNKQSPIIAHVETGVAGKVVECTVDWCKLDFSDAEGFLPKTEFWGVYPTELLK